MSDKKWWIITVAGDYGSFALYCDRDKAEEFRRHKARWEAAVAKLREADESNATDARMIRSARISPCYLDGNLSLTVCARPGNRRAIDVAGGTQTRRCRQSPDRDA